MPRQHEMARFWRSRLSAGGVGSFPHDEEQALQVGNPQIRVEERGARALLLHRSTNMAQCAKMVAPPPWSRSRQPACESHVLVLPIWSHINIIGTGVEPPLGQNLRLALDEKHIWSSTRKA